MKEGDTVFDIGAWIGDTAYVFSEKMSGTGKIYGFEPMLQNYEMLAENKDKIPNLSIHNIAFGKENGTLRFAFWGNSGMFASSRQAEKGEYEVKVSTVDNFVKENGIERVDFIKTDIEGAECDMLLGTAEAIKRFHPKLAICIYHRGQIDHYEVPKTILSIRQDYEFYLEAYQNSLYETVLFAFPVDYIPERQEICSKTVSAIKEMYISVHNRLYKESFFTEFRQVLNQHLNRFDWAFYNNDARLSLNNNKKIHYKLLFVNNKISVQLVFEGFETYSDVHKNKIMEVLDHFHETHTEYELSSNKNAMWICSTLPLSATPESVASNMAVFINETAEGLWKAGIIEPEYAVVLLKNKASLGKASDTLKPDLSTNKPNLQKPENDEADKKIMELNQQKDKVSQKLLEAYRQKMIQANSFYMQPKRSRI